MHLVTKRATSWGAVLVSAPGGRLYGMNFEHMELHWRLGYPVTLGITALLATVLYVTFRRRDRL